MGIMESENSSKANGSAAVISVVAVVINGGAAAGLYRMAAATLARASTIQWRRQW